MAELIGFVGSYHMDRSLNFDCQRCINMFPQVSASGTSKTPAKLVSAPGLGVFCDFRALANSGVRGTHKFDENSLFVVAGSKVLRVNATGVATLIGSIDLAPTPVQMEDNGSTVFIATGPTGWTINAATNVVTQYTDTNFHGADCVGFITGSLVWNEPGSGRFWATQPYSLTLDPLWFATAEASPDPLVAIGMLNQEIWLFGSETLEVWSNVGQAGFPFARVTGAVIEYGCAAKNSVAKLDSSLFWLSANKNGQGAIYRSVGLNAQRVSNHSVEQEIATYAVISDANAYAYEQEGHKFYVLNFPTQNVTWVYDTVTATWHQRAYLEATGLFSRHRSNNHAFFNRQNIVGDWSQGILYNMSTLIYSDNGNPLRRVRSSPHIAVDGSKVGHVNVEFEIGTGVGLQSGQGSDPQLMMRFSNDYGHTWSNQRMKSIGKVGKYRQRVRFTRLGQARDRVYEVSFSDPVPFTILGARVNAEQ